MSAARYIVGPALDVVRSMPDRSVQSAITSPPYFRKRAYLPVDHPDAALEVGQEDTPADFLAALLELTDELWRVVADDGTIWVNLGDTAAGSGGPGGDYNAGGAREGQGRWLGTARSREGFPRAKSVCWVPEMFGASLAYGRNLLTGEPCRQWITRPPVTWCKPSPPVGEIIDKFREATELIVWASKEPRYYFDLDAVRVPSLEPSTEFGMAAADERGAPPLNWWEVTSSSYKGAHFATFPPELIRRPVLASCPPGGTILDPFAGSGTTLLVATGNGRDAIGVDLDARNADLALERVGMFLTVEHFTPQPSETATC